MHILEIPSFFPPLGGAFCLEQAKALQGRGHEVRILSLNQHGITKGLLKYLCQRRGRWQETTDGIDVLRSNMHALPRMTRSNQQRWCGRVVSMYQEYRNRYGKPDVLHAHCCQWAGVAARMIAEAEGIPYFITEHISKGPFEVAHGKGWTRHKWAKLLLKETYEKTSCVIPVSEELVDNLQCFFGKEYRWRSVSNVIDVDFFAYHDREAFHNRETIYERESYHEREAFHEREVSRCTEESCVSKVSEERPFRFCCLAVSEGEELYWKGYDVLSEAFCGMTGCELHIAGRGTDRKELKEMFPTNTFFYGELDKCGVRDILYKCDALVLASRSEVQPLVLLEAMSTGIPVVSTECVPQSERVEGACLISRTGDAMSLRAKMLEAMMIAPSRDVSSEIRAMASPDVVARQLEQIFSSYRK